MTLLRRSPPHLLLWSRSGVTPLPRTRQWGSSEATSLRLRWSPPVIFRFQEDSFASDYSGGGDEGGTYLCPAWAIKHPILHLVYTSAYQGDDCTGDCWASASPGERFVTRPAGMRIVTRPADTAIGPCVGRRRGRFSPSGHGFYWR